MGSTRLSMFWFVVLLCCFFLCVCLIMKLSLINLLKKIGSFLKIWFFWISFLPPISTKLDHSFFFTNPQMNIMNSSRRQQMIYSNHWSNMDFLLYLNSVRNISIFKRIQLKQDEHFVCVWIENSLKKAVTGRLTLFLNPAYGWWEFSTKQTPKQKQNKKGRRDFGTVHISLWNFLRASCFQRCWNVAFQHILKNKKPPLWNLL